MATGPHPNHALIPPDPAPTPHPALGIACPFCEQPIGEPCMTGGAPPQVRDEPHKVRREAWDAAQGAGSSNSDGGGG